jgi:hypothetical protein
MVSARHGQPLVFYRTDNEISRQRAGVLCRPNCRETVLSGLPWPAYKPKEPRSTQSEWYRPTALPGAVAAAYKYLLQHGKEPTAEAITEFLEGGYSLASDRHCPDGPTESGASGADSGRGYEPTVNG